ncbi:MAG: tRNA (adenosine(37)-N6)-threonylcarbamoyltransferase complex transferase subunit TsaD, partial [Parcubacteria group bacterium]|nr:tRNA (adenosine(37)-N6)-threonylcarbamoyltransferase complex transferase subunit TsaD [Parcubacteria group bacterium]NQU82652.1 tRNA (adenosine(37)-N6)-threonylcarbamoyltransferase complex transferase subunit TsaD [Parcubacteria group bacterium]
IEAHILINFLEQDVELPAIALIVSGGHTQLILVKKIGKYEIIGETRDDAAGECFDKTARILGLDYPGGPEIAKKATKESNMKIEMPRPMLHTKDYDFSFSGLKTAVLYDYKKRPKKQRQSQEYIIAMAKEIQQSIIDVLIKKTLKAVEEYKVKTVLLGGGVTANSELRKQFKEQLSEDIEFLVPEKGLSTDNAVMIGLTALLRPNSKKIIKAQGNLRI